MPKNDHVHKYKRTTLGKEYVIYRCMKVGCSHYIPPELIIGRISECWRCGEAFEIEKGRINVMPICKECRPHKPTSVGDKLASILGVIDGD